MGYCLLLLSLVLGGMSSRQFIQDRERGKPGQQYVAEMLRSWGHEVEEVPDGYFPGYDLKLKIGGTIEVKHDYLSEKTGNVFLELEALNHSQADWLAIVTD